MTYPTLDDLKHTASELSQTYEINWETIENSTQLMDMKRLLTTMHNKLPELETYYLKLTTLDHSKVKSSMGIHQYTGLVLDIQDELIDAYSCVELMARIDGVLSLTGGG